MDRLVFTAMASLKQLNNMKLKYANALANASTVGFKQLSLDVTIFVFYKGARLVLILGVLRERFLK